MKKSVSIPNFTSLGSQPKNLPMRKSVSTNALASLDMTTSIDLVDAVFVSNAPIHQTARCILPDALTPNFKVNDEVMTCLLTPCEAPELKDEPVETESTLNKTYLQLALENEDVRNKYMRWLARIRKMKNKA